MRRIIQFFINRPIWGNATIAIILMFGLFSVFTMKRSFFPELDPARVVVSVFYPGASPAEMEQGITIKVEQAIKGLNGIERVDASSSENFANIRIKAYTGTDMEELLNEVKNAVNSINSFPVGAEKPTVTRLKSNGMSSTVAFVGVAAKSPDANMTDLTNVVNQIETDLLNTKEITQITKFGFPEKEISITVREQDLLRFNISIQEIALAVGSKNIDITTGIIRGGIEEMSVRSNNRTSAAEEIAEIPIRSTTTGESIKIKDVANVKLGYAESSQESLFNGNPFVQFQIEKTLDQDIAKITEALHKYEDKFNEENPDYSFETMFAFNDMLNERIDLLSENGLMGLILVLFFLGIFLNLRLSAWVAFGIPFSFLGMFIFGIPYGMTINMISLFGMILVVGILVDDGIVIAENIYTHYEKGKAPHKAALDGTMEVLTSVFSSVLTTIVAFSMLLFIEGMEMMREMAFVVIACLAFSLYEAFIILPAHLGHESVLSEKKDNFWSWQRGLLFMLVGIAVCYLGIKVMGTSEGFGMKLFPFSLIIAGVGLLFIGYSKSRIETNVRLYADKGIKYVRNNWFKNAVEMIVGTKRPWYILGFLMPLFFLITVIGFLNTGLIGSTIFPDIKPDFINIEVAYSPGESKEKTRGFLNDARRILREENQRIIDENGDSLVNDVTMTIGFSENIGQVGNHTGELGIFYNGEDVDTPIDTLVNRITRRLEVLPSAQLAQETFIGGFNRFGKDIEIGFTSKNESDLNAAAEIFKEELFGINGVFNIKDNMPPGRTEVYLQMKPQAEIYGLSQNEVLTQIRNAFFGQEAQRVIIGTDEVKIWVKYPSEGRQSLSDLEQMNVTTMQGLVIPLTEICDFELGRAPETLRRKDGQRVIIVDAECMDPDKVGDINTRISDSILPKIMQAFPAVQNKTYGQAEQAKKTQDSMMYVLLIGLAIMFIILMLQFSSLSSAFLILLVIPAGVAGAILGHGLIGIPVSTLSAFGMVALIGVLINDAIVFLNRYNDLIVEGWSIKEAAVEAAVSRFRPIVLTSLTTVAGLLPIISETSMQAQFLIPMAASIAFGVLFGTIFILFFYPAAILVWNWNRRVGKRFWKGQRFEDPRLAEPSVKLMDKKYDFDEE